MFVYFIQGIEGGPIKIGRARKPQIRLRVFQIACPIRLRILGVMEGDLETETKLHRRFATYRLHGEWFQVSPELLALIRENAISLETAGLDLNDTVPADTTVKAMTFFLSAECREAIDDLARQKTREKGRRVNKNTIVEEAVRLLARKEGLLPNRTR